MTGSDVQISTVLQSLVTGLAVAVGGAVNAWLTRREKRIKDVTVAREKIRAIEMRLKMPPATVETLDDVFQALRVIEVRVDELEKMAPVGKTIADLKGHLDDAG